jgi:hypothetical protein
MRKPTLSPLQRFRLKYCGRCSYRNDCLNDKTMELSCLLAALQGSISEDTKIGAEKCLKP